MKIYTFQIVIIIYIILMFCSSLQNMRNWKNFWNMLVYVKQQWYITCQIWNQTQKRVFLYWALEGSRSKRTHTLMWCINESYQKLWGRICYTKTTRPQLMQTNNFNPAGSDFFTLNRLGAGPLCFPTPLLHND